MALNKQFNSIEDESAQEAARRKIKERQEADKLLQQQMFGSPTVETVQRVAGDEATSLEPAQQTQTRMQQTNVDGYVDPRQAPAYLAARDLNLDTTNNLSPNSQAAFNPAQAPAFNLGGEEEVVEETVVEEAPQSKLAQSTAILRNGVQGPWRSEELVNMNQRDTSMDPYGPVIAQGGNRFTEYERNNEIPEGYLSRLSQLESGGNPNAVNKTSGAAGEWQMMPSFMKQYGVKDPFNQQEALEGVIRGTKDAQRQFYEKYGRQPTGPELYLMHQQGITGAFNLIDNPDKLATSIRPSKAITGNGGNKEMTSAQFLDMWNQKYEGLNPRYEEAGAGEPLDVTPPAPLDSFVKTEVNAEQAQQEALKEAGLDDPTINFVKSQNLKPGETKIVNASEMGLRFGDDFVHRDRAITDSGALWQGILAGGLAMLGVALGGGDRKDFAAAFAIGGGGRFIDAMNQSHRYKNLQALKNMGYDPAGIEEYIQNGNRGALKVMEVGDWKELPDGSGMFTRRLPNGQVELMQGQPKYVEVKQFDPETGITSSQYWDGHTKTWKLGEDGQPLRSHSGVDKEWIKSKQVSKYGIKPGETRRVINETTKKVTDVKETSDGKLVDVLTQQEVPVEQGGYRLLSNEEYKDALKLESQNKKAAQIAEEGKATLNYEARNFYDADGNLKTARPPMKSETAEFIASGTWGNYGGGRGQPPILEDLITSNMANTPEGQFLRQRISEAITIQGNIRQIAIAAARASGASGINTVAEVKLYAESFPQVDFSSYEAMVESVQRIQNSFDARMQIYLDRVRGSSLSAGTLTDNSDEKGEEILKNVMANSNQTSTTTTNNGTTTTTGSKLTQNEDGSFNFGGLKFSHVK